MKTFKYVLPAIAVLVGDLATARQAPPSAVPPSSHQTATDVVKPLSAADIRATVMRLGEALAANYVVPETGERYAAMLRTRAATGDYDWLSDPAQLAKRLTDDLQVTHTDQHLRIFPPGAALPAPRRGSGNSAPSIEAAQWIADGVAYIRFNSLTGDPATVAALDRFMRDHADARALIIDSRTNRGGGAGPTDAMLPFLFDKPTVLYALDTRAGPDAAGLAPFMEGPLVRRVPSPPTVVRRERSIHPHPSETRLFDAKLFYLTSNRTASAGEAFALILKRTKRGTLVGERTLGAGHFARIFPVGAGFNANIPIGRTFDPDTGEGWEGTGVVPDVAVPADEALHEALRLAGVADGAKLAAAVAAAR